MSLLYLIHQNMLGLHKICLINLQHLKKIVHRRFCGTAQLSLRHFICYRLICSEITRKVSDPISLNGGVNVVLTNILDPTWTMHWRRGGRRSPTTSFVYFDIVTNSETVTIKLQSKKVNWTYPHPVCVRPCITLKSILLAFFKVGDIEISSPTFYSLFTVLIVFVVHYTCNYQMRHFICSIFTVSLTSSIFLRALSNV
jgi:hypothetical protein